MSEPLYRRIFADMKRRKVFQVITVYGATGFVLLQVVELLAEGMGFPPSVLRITTLVTLLGLPVAILLAWILEVTDGSVRRTDSAAEGELEGIIAESAAARWVSGVLALASMAALVGGAWWAGRSLTVGGPETEVAGPEVIENSDAVLRVAYADLSLDSRPSVAVLPFADMSQDQDQEYFADGMSEEIISALAKIRAIRVTGRTSSFAYRGENRDIRQIGAALGVRYLIEGSVRKQGNQLRITALLVDTTDNFQIWSETYNRTLDDIFEVQSGIAESVARQLQVSLELTTTRDLVFPTLSMPGYDLYLRGRAHMRARGPGVAEAVRLFTQAVELDDAWAPAWAGLAQAQSLLPYYAGEGASASADPLVWGRLLHAAEIAARRALTLDPGSAEAEVALGNVGRDRWDVEEAERHYLRALRSDPDNAEAHQQYAELLAALGRLDEALRSARRGVELDPSPIRHNARGYIAHMNRRYGESLESLEAAIANEAGLLNAYRNLVVLHLALGDLDGALEALGHILDADELVLFERSFLAGDGAGIERCCAGKFSGGAIQAAAGNPSAAVAWFQEHLAEGARFGSVEVLGLWYPEMDEVRLLPEMRAVLERVGLWGVEVKRDAPGG